MPLPRTPCPHRLDAAAPLHARTSANELPLPSSSLYARSEASSTAWAQRHHAGNRGPHAAPPLLETRVRRVPAGEAGRAYAVEYHMAASSILPEDPELASLLEVSGNAWMQARCMSICRSRGLRLYILLTVVSCLVYWQV
jgi:proteinaceous RNase P